MKTKLQSNNRGFTLLELLAVMGIMLILSTIAVTSYRAMITGSGINASLGHLRQSLALARQQAIMQGKSAYVVFYQDTNESWYVTCLGQGRNSGSTAGILKDEYRADIGAITDDSLLYNLSADKCSFAEVTGTSYDSSNKTYRIATSPGIWGGGSVYGWEVSQRIKLPRGFRFKPNSGDAPSTIRFKPSGIAVRADGDGLAGSGADEIRIYEEIRPTEKYTVKVNFNGSTQVQYD